MKLLFKSGIFKVFCAVAMSLLAHEYFNQKTKIQNNKKQNQYVDVSAENNLRDVASFGAMTDYLSTQAQNKYKAKKKNLKKLNSTKENEKPSKNFAQAQRAFYESINKPNIKKPNKPFNHSSPTAKTKTNSAIGNKNSSKETNLASSSVTNKNNSFLNNDKGVSSLEPDNAKESKFLSGNIPALNCVNPEIKIFDLDTVNILYTNPIFSSELSDSSSFSLEISELPVNKENPTKYLLKIFGCDYPLEKIISNFHTDQSLTYASTVIASSLRSSTRPSLSEIKTKILDILVQEINDTNFDSSFDKLNLSELNKTRYTESLPNSNYLDLKKSWPVVTSLNIPLNLTENSNFNFEAELFHWSSDYEKAYEWTFDGEIKSNDAIWSHTPHANSKLNSTLKLVIGHKNSSDDNVDRSLPYQEFEYNLITMDQIPVIAPLISLNSSVTNPTPDKNIIIDVITGPITTESFENCKTFSTFAITETPLPPTSDQFIYSCTTAGIQEVAYEILSPDGEVELHAWGKDANGNISSFEKISITTDTTPPQIAYIDDFSSFYRADRDYELSWTVTEAHQTATESHLVEFFNGTTWITLPSVSSSEGELTSQNFSTTFHFPDISTTNAKFKITLKDALGNTASVETQEFAIYRPVLGLTPPAISLGNILNKSNLTTTTLTLKNSGLVESDSCAGLSLSGANSSEFSIASSTCLNEVLTSNESCDVVINATPETKGPKNALFSITCGPDTLSTSLSYTSINNAPVSPNHYALSIVEDTPENFTANIGSDLDSDSLTYKIINLPAHGSLSGCMTNDSDLTCQYVPDLNYNGVDSFSYQVNDGTVDSVNTTTVTLNIQAVNDAPTLALTQAVSTDEDTPLTFNLTSGSDVESDPLTYIKVSDTSNGSINCVNQECTYTPNPNFNGSDSFTYKVNDGELDSTVATVLITVNPVNDAPTLALTQTVSTDEDIPLTFNLTSGSDIEGSTLTYIKVSDTSNGSISCTLQECTYTPNLNFNGSDSFTYKVNDGELDSTTATVIITVNSVNDAPTLATTQSVSTDEDTPLTFNLTSGSDVEFSTLTYIKVTETSNGSISCTGQECTYTPNPHFNGSDSFTYKVNDGELDSIVATVLITVNPVNDAPTLALTQTVSTDEDIPITFNLTSGSDIEGSSLTYIKVTNTSNGSISCTLQECTYTPNLNFNGSDSFTYKVNDGELDSTTATVLITVNSVNDAPEMIANQTFTITDQEIFNFTLLGAIDIDLPAQTLTYQIVTDITSGTLSNCLDSLSFKNDLTCSYTPVSNFDGVVSFTYKAYDSLLESLTTSTITINVQDKTPSPIPSITLASNYYTNDLNVSLTVNSCDDIQDIYISTSSATPTDLSSWATCSTTGGAFTTTLSGTNGLNTIYAWSRDDKGNIQETPASTQLIYDDVSPVISLNTHNITSNSLNQIPFKLTEINTSSSQNVEVEFFNGTSWITSETAMINGPVLTHEFFAEVEAPASGGITVQLKLTFTDLAGNTASVTKTFMTDADKPVVASLSFNGGATQTMNNNIQAAVSGNDGTSKVKSFCLKYNDSTQPLENASCWVDVDAPSPGITPAMSINFNNFYFQIGFVKADYVIYAWLKDEAGQISQNTETLDVDKYIIHFDPGTPPIISNIQVTSDDSPHSPPLVSELTASSGSPIYVKWDASDAEGLAANPISISYTTNNNDYIDLVTDIPNSANGGCSLTGGFTGCKVLNSPTSGYFKIRVTAKDSVETTVFVSAPALNDPHLTIIAGNTSDGLDGSAGTALYYTIGTPGTSGYTRKNRLVVSDDGKFFYLDPKRGLLWINPMTGVLKNFIPTTGSSSGDGGDISSATLKSPQGIFLDYQNNLLIWDSNRLRQVNLSNMTISTLLGGGSQSDPNTTVNADQISLASFNSQFGTLIPMPNGDILFASSLSSFSNRRYRASDQKIEPITIEGVGVAGYPTEVWTTAEKRDFAVSFDTTTSEINYMLQGFRKAFTGDSYVLHSRIDHTSGDATSPYQGIGPYNINLSRTNIQTGHDGKIYVVDRFRRKIELYNYETNIRTAVVGTGGTASKLCAENTLATSCPVDIDTYFITRSGRPYFVDQGVIRTVNDEGKVISLFGQHPSHGDGELATLSRFGDLVAVQMDKPGTEDNKLIAYDRFNMKLRTFTIGGNLTELASLPSGNNQGPYNFMVNRTNGNVLSSRTGSVLVELDRATSSWSNIVGGGSTYYSSADGKTGNEVKLYSYPREVNGFHNNKLLYTVYRYQVISGVGTKLDQMTKIYDGSDFWRQSHFMGITGTMKTKVTPDTSLANQEMRPTNIEYFQDPTDSQFKYFFAEYGGNTIYTGIVGGNMKVFQALPRGIPSFTYSLSGGLKFYYCSGGKLWQYDYAEEEETQLSWIAPGLTCKSSQAIIYNQERNSIIFPVTENGIDAVAEYLFF